MKNLDARQGLAAGAAIVTIALTAAAFWLSYEHLHDVAHENGLDGIRAWAWPGTVDLFIVAGELLILRAALRGGFDWFAYLLAGVGSLGSIALNVAGVGADAALMEYIVAAVPPVAALLAFAAVMRQVHERLAGHVEATTEVAEGLDVIHGLPGFPEPAPVVTAPVIEVPDVSPLWHDWTPREVTAAVPAEDNRQVVTEVVKLTPADLRRKARSLQREAVRSTNRPVTIKTLQDELGLSRREATELRREVVTS
jgi:TRAP-type C4-dicarboxylate transport system permease small subunit